MKNIILSFPAIWTTAHKSCMQSEIKAMSRSYSHYKSCDHVCMSFWSNSSDCTARLVANMMINHKSEMELYIILATFDKFEHWNRILLTMKFHLVKRSQFSVLW